MRISRDRLLKIAEEYDRIAELAAERQKDAGCGFLQKPILQKPWTDGELAEEVTLALAKIRCLGFNDQEHFKSSHAAGHEAADRGSHVVADRPNHGSSHSVRLGDDGIVRNVNPLIVEPYAVVAVAGFPIDIANRRAVGVGATGSLARSQLVEPGLQRRIGMAAVVACVRR
jgi:hypothetical protein